MNFDELKKEWNEDSNEEIKLPVNLEKLKPALSPIEKIKSNIKKEFYLQLVGFVIIALYPFIFKLNIFLSTLYFIIYLILFAISIVYFLKFKRFFNYINHTTLNSKDNLYEIYYEIKVNIEIYKNWNYVITPFVIIIVIILTVEKSYHINSEIFNNYQMLLNTAIVCIISFFISLLMINICIHFWIKYFYKKHLYKIKELIDQLKETDL